MRIDVWSDIACPWCWLGKHHLAEAVRRSGRGDLEIEYHSFELQPDAKGVRPVREYLLERYGDARRIEAGHAHLREAGRAVGIAYDFERALMMNTFDAHRIHQLAKARGVGDVVLERLMRARQGEGADLSDHAALRTLAIEAGLDAAAVDEVLASDAYADNVRADEAMARELGIHGVPFFVIDGKHGVSGAQPVEFFERVLAKL